MVSIGIFASAIFGYVQWFMGTTPWTLLLIPIGVLIITGLHLASPDYSCRPDRGRYTLPERRKRSLHLAQRARHNKQ